MRMQLSIKTVISLMLITLLSACTTGKKAVSFTEVNNYFYHNDAPDGEQLMKLTSQEEFDRYFGAAAFMGKNGEPTRIDFSKNFVVAKVLPETSKDVEISNISLERTNEEKLILSYKKTEKGEQGYTIRPTFQIIVSREYIGDSIVIQEN